MIHLDGQWWAAKAIALKLARAPRLRGLTRAAGRVFACLEQLAVSDEFRVYVAHEDISSCPSASSSSFDFAAPRATTP